MINSTRKVAVRKLFVIGFDRRSDGRILFVCLLVGGSLVRLLLLSADLKPGYLVRDYNKMGLL